MKKKVKAVNGGGGRKVNGRHLRKTNRTLQFATRVTPEFDQTIRQLAQEENCLIIEILEKSLNAYLEKKKASIKVKK